MHRKAFRQLLRRYLDNSCTDEERRIIDQWYELLDHEQSPLSNEEVTKVEKRLWQKIQSVTSNDSSAAIPFKNHKNNWWKYAVAASFIGVVILFGSLVLKNKTKSSDTPSLVIAKVNQGYSEEINNSGNIKKIQLEDGSFVSIYPGSKLAFPKHFASDKREVYLEGEALFTVSKSPNRPFFVYNNQIVTQVLGTSFTVQNKNGKIECVVCAIPYLRDSDIRTAMESETYKNRVEQKFLGMKAYFDTVVNYASVKYGENVTVILMGHLFTSGVTTSDSERDIQRGGLEMFSANDFPKNCKYIALGHIHKPQQLFKHGYMLGSPIHQVSNDKAEMGYWKIFNDRAPQFIGLANIFPRFRKLVPGEVPDNEKDYFIMPDDQGLVEEVEKGDFDLSHSRTKLAKRYMKVKGIKDKKKKAALINILNQVE